MKRRRRWIVLLLAFLLVAGSVATCNWTVGQASAGRVYSDPDLVPASRVAVVLGTAPRFGDTPNLYFIGRMAAAARLYKSGKLQRLLVSGTNDRADYDEPTAMKAALIKLGVPEDAIVADYAGKRTLDTVVRTKKVFGLDECIFVTDDFHMARTLWLARESGIRAVGYTAKSLPVSVSPMTHLREIAARVLVVLDVKVFHRGPQFLGKRETI